MTFDHVDYWERRYGKGHGSGVGSEGDSAIEKAERVHAALASCAGRRVLDLGCGGGQVAQHLDVRSYVGVDVSATAIDQCIAVTGRRPGWAWLLIDPTDPPQIEIAADVAVSFDVIFHLDDDALDWHLALLFGPTIRRALIRSTDQDAAQKGHMYHHRWSHRIPPGWRVIAQPSDSVGLWEVSR